MEKLGYALSQPAGKYDTYIDGAGGGNEHDSPRKEHAPQTGLTSSHCNRWLIKNILYSNAMIVKP